MVIGHICNGAFLDRIVHAVPWIDGASGFILISGLVLGMISRRRADSAGLVRAEGRLARRTALLYVSHVAVTALSVIVSRVTTATNPSPPGNTGSSAAQIVGWLSTMQINPPSLDILSMYVVLLALAMAWVPLLRRGWWPAVVVLSMAMYVVALTTDWGRLPDRPDGWAYFNTAAWQAVFCSAFIAGWYWSRLGEWLCGRAALVIAVGGGALTAAGGIVLHHAGKGSVLFDKPDCGLGRILLAWAAFVVLYQLMRLLLARTPALVMPIAVVGSRSLACFIALCVIGTLLPLAIGYDSTTFVAQVAGVVVVAAMYPVARARGMASDALNRRRLRPSEA